MSEIVVQGVTPGIRVSGSGSVVTVKVTTGSGGGGGVTDHNALTGRSDPDQHPIGAVTGLQGALDGKVSTSDQRLSDARTPTAHAVTHGSGGTDPITISQSQVTDLTTDLAAKADLVGGKIVSSQIPDLAITDTFVVPDQTAMLALVAETGDVAVRTDTSKSFILAGADPAVLSDWVELQTPGAPVTSVNSQTGAVVLGSADVGAAAAGHSHDITSLTTSGPDGKMPVTASGGIALVDPPSGGSDGYSQSFLLGGM